MVRFLLLALGMFIIPQSFSQGDVLVSKGSGFLRSSGNQIWMFNKSSDSENLSFSRINFFTNPPEVYTTKREEYPLTHAVSVGRTVFGHSIKEVDFYPEGDGKDIWVGFFQLESSDDKERFDFIYQDNSGLSSAVEISDLDVWDSLIFLSYGNGGIAALEYGSEANNWNVNMGESLGFFSLDKNDSLQQILSCSLSDTCSFSALNGLENDIGVLYIDELALSSVNDSLFVYVIAGSSSEDENNETGSLKKGLWGEGKLQDLNIPELENLELGANLLSVNPNNNILWLFAKNSLYLSSDRGNSFQKAQGIPEDILSRYEKPSLAFLGDSTLINFNFPNNPGLVYFLGDSLLSFPQEENDPYSTFLEPDLRQLLPPGISLGEIAIASEGNENVIAVGSAGQGLFYKMAESDEPWQNLILQTGVKKGLSQVITFPSIFDGSGTVGLGYQISNDANVTIKVFNYAMEEVRTLVKSGKRVGGGSRSENTVEDRWDGRDDHGNLVAAGMYYIQVDADSGERGWGKVMVVSGR